MGCCTLTCSFSRLPDIDGICDGGSFIGMADFPNLLVSVTHGDTIVDAVIPVTV